MNVTVIAVFLRHVVQYACRIDSWQKRNGLHSRCLALWCKIPVPDAELIRDAITSYSGRMFLEGTLLEMTVEVGVYILDRVQGSCECRRSESYEGYPLTQEYIFVSWRPNLFHCTNVPADRLLLRTSVWF